MAGKFNKHGSLSVAIDGRLIVLNGEGPWNAESLHLSDDKIMQNLRAMYGSPWGVLAIFRGEAVYVPEAFALLRKQIKKEILSKFNLPLEGFSHPCWKTRNEEKSARNGFLFIFFFLCLL